VAVVKWRRGRDLPGSDIIETHLERVVDDIEVSVAEHGDEGEGDDELR
jgi:hypothetical protein